MYCALCSFHLYTSKVRLVYLKEFPFVPRDIPQDKLDSFHPGRDITRNETEASR